MKAILLAGGSGTRLYPATLGLSKQHLYVAGKPLFYYPLSLLMLAGCKDILIISTPKDIPVFEYLLGNGSHLGMNISYIVQPYPAGIAQAFILGKDFIGNDEVMLILGDNIFHGGGLTGLLEQAVKKIEDEKGAMIFAYRVQNAQRYGTVIFDEHNKPVDIVEKDPLNRSPYAIPGLYLYDNSVVDIAKDLRPSDRGELEITDINREYLKRGTLRVEKMQRGIAWLDAGTVDSMHDAQTYIYPIEKRQGLLVGCIEEVAYRKGYITKHQLAFLIDRYKHSQWKNEYFQYLEQLYEGELD